MEYKFRVAKSNNNNNNVTAGRKLSLVYAVKCIIANLNMNRVRFAQYDHIGYHLTSTFSNIHK